MGVSRSASSVLRSSAGAEKASFTPSKSPMRSCVGDNDDTEGDDDDDPERPVDKYGTLNADVELQHSAAQKAAAVVVVGVDRVMMRVLIVTKVKL